MAGHSKPPKRSRAPSGAAGHSRAKAASWQEVELRVERIMAIMCDGAWTRKARKALGAELGVSDDVMRRAAAEASRRLRSGLGDPEKLRRRLRGKLGAAFRLAERRGDPKAMVAAVAEEARITGAAAPIKVAATNAAGEDVSAFDDVLADPLFAVRAKYGADVAEQLRRLLPPEK